MAFSFVMLGLFLQFTISSNLLFIVGVPYDVPGGLPIFKLHPATYLAVFALFLLLTRDGRPVRGYIRIAKTRPGLTIFIVAMGLCVIYSIASNGITGAATFIESYMSAWALAVVLETLSDRQTSQLRRLMVLMVTANVLIGLFEATMRFHLVPVYLDGEVLPDLRGEFRANALYDHPLTAAMVTQMGVFLLLGSHARAITKTAGLALLLVGLLAWGGRTAFVVTGLVLAAMGGLHVLRAIVRRTLGLTLSISILAVAIATPILLFFLLTQTSVGERIAARFYFDDSAQGRALQWRLLSLIDTKEFLFGTSTVRLPQLAFVLGLQFPFEDIENPWLLAFLNLGLAGFIIYAVGLLPFIRHLWRVGSPTGRVMLVSVMLVTSTSNSLGRKSNILFLLTASIYATAAGRLKRGRQTSSDTSRTPEPSRPGLRRPRQVLEQTCP